MNHKKITLYLGSVVLLIIGAYNAYKGQISQGLIWIILGVIFLSTTPQLGHPIKAVKVRKGIILLCALILLGIGANTLLTTDLIAGIAWLIAGLMGILISIMLVGKNEVLES